MYPGSLDNSAQAEYEGLLMGLEKAVSMFQDGQLTSSVTQKIYIQGDCKTVMDQMKEAARPRKLESHYRRAQDCLRQLQNDHSIPEIQFHHIPREDNVLCDGICGIIRSDIIEQDAWQSALQCIQELELGATRTDDESTILSRCIGRENKSLIPYSKRPHLYHRLAQKVRENSDYQTLVEIGGQMELEAKTIWTNVPAHRSDGKNLQALGIGLQIEGFKGLETRKSLRAAFVKERQNRFLLERHDAVPASFNHLAVSSPPPPPAVGDKESTNQELESLWETWLENARASDEWRQKQCLWIHVPLLLESCLLD